MNTNLVDLPTDITRAFGTGREEESRNIALQLAVDMYRDGKWSTGKAAEAAGMGLIAFMEVLKDRKVQVPYTKDMLEEDFAHARRSL